MKPIHLDIVTPYEALAVLKVLDGRSRREAEARRLCLRALLEQPYLLCLYLDFIQREEERWHEAELVDHLKPGLNYMKQAAREINEHGTSRDALCLLVRIPAEKYAKERLVLVRKILRLPICKWLTKRTFLDEWKKYRPVAEEVTEMFAVVKRSRKKEWAEALLDLGYNDDHRWPFTSEQVSWLEKQGGDGRVIVAEAKIFDDSIEEGVANFEQALSLVPKS